MKIKKLVIFALMIVNSNVFSQSASTNPTNTNSVLMAKTVKAYQIKSENKIEEFYNLLNIVGNPDVQIVLKEQTILEVNKLFKDKKIKIPNLIEDKNKVIALDDFLNLLFKSKEKVFFEIANKGSSTVQESNGNKFWTIGFDLSISNGKIKSRIKNVMQNVSLLQEQKEYGSTKKMIRNVYLDLIWLK